MGINSELTISSRLLLATIKGNLGCVVVHEMHPLDAPNRQTERRLSFMLIKSCLATLGR